MALWALAQAAAYRPSEPCFHYDETRHLLTGVFFRDFLVDLPLGDPAGYVVQYYLQYPALALIVWPPLFHFCEGMFMLIFGTSLLAAQVLVGLFAVLASWYLFLLVSRTHGRFTAALAAALLAFSPLVFRFSRHVMLEVPTLTFALAATYHLLLYLDGRGRRQVFLAGIVAAFCGLTRFDGVFLLPLFLLLVWGRKRWDLLRRGEVWAAAALTVALVAPFYWITASRFGWLHLQAIQSGTFEGSSQFMAARNFLYYPLQLPRQMGWPAAAFGVLGLLTSLWPGRRRASWPYLATALCVYAFFSPMAELDFRHTIYWVPAFALFASAGVSWASERLEGPVPRVFLAFLLVGATAWTALSQPPSFVRGYEEAARFVLETTTSSPFCLIDCYLDGDFIYQVRRADPERRLWVLRGDKILYGTLGEPHAGYRELVKDDPGILERIYRYDPELIVVDEPQAYHDIPMARRLRESLRAHPERFRLERSVPLESNFKRLQGVNLLIYRNLARNPHPETRLEVEMLGLRRSISTRVR